MALSNVSSMQGSFDMDFKSDEDIDLHDFSNNEQDMKEKHMRLLQDSMRMSKMNEKRALKLKNLESQNTSLQAKLEDSQAKVRQVEDQRSALSNYLIDAGKENKLLKDHILKATVDMDKLQ